ncbi:hypothetical protein CC80DRAFT_209682 [Byssothecium circinans]|uniref:Uncharacterized protein n=1 Tax=Byssothecium circinans TaxID=147558 RepID=A0A6A5TGS5_9PLEO|nr:hypothetical protein CC80DRAFT_209682 [Byssothecium circinans]
MTPQSQPPDPPNPQPDAPRSLYNHIPPVCSTKTQRYQNLDAYARKPYGREENTCFYLYEMVERKRRKGKCKGKMLKIRQPTQNEKGIKDQSQAQAQPKPISYIPMHALENASSPTQNGGEEIRVWRAGWGPRSRTYDRHKGGFQFPSSCDVEESWSVVNPVSLVVKAA